MSRRAVKVISFVLALIGAPIAAIAQAAAPPVANTPFDYYVMTLSWAPGFCDLGGQDTSSPECAASTRSRAASSTVFLRSSGGTASPVVRRRWMFSSTITVESMIQFQIGEQRFKLKVQ